MKPKLWVSFSGGKTSAYMTKLILDNWCDLYDIVVIFANTGQEHEETLKFVNKCDKIFKFNTVWVECVIHSGRKGTTHKIINFDSASRKGQPYESMIKKYGIPNMSFPHCTRELKLRPMYSYIKSLGWKQPKVAIGIREDEKKRMTKNYKHKGLLYPLIDNWPSDKIDVNNFWEDQFFSLNLQAYEGNCIWCWKKSDKKLYMLIKENEAVFDFPERMELKNGMCGAGNVTPRKFFRNYRSTINLKNEAQMISLNYLENIVDKKISTGCSESCEISIEEVLK